MNKTETMRLDAFLSRQNCGSRKAVAALVRKGAVQVDGLTVKKADAQIDPLTQQVVFQGVPITYRKFNYIMMNKPAGVLSAARDSRAKTVLDLLPPDLHRRGLFPAGRLDKDTTGLMILTDDGNFAHDLLSPKKHVDKLYVARTKRLSTAADVAAFEAGIAYGGQQYAPAVLTDIAQRADGFFSSVVIQEGKFHQVKRMFLACGNEVLSLQRLRMGGLTLDPALPLGMARRMEEHEAFSVFS